MITPGCVCDTPTFDATCEIDNPSLMTANTAWYRCSPSSTPSP